MVVIFTANSAYSHPPKPHGHKSTKKNVFFSRKKESDYLSSFPDIVQTHSSQIRKPTQTQPFQFTCFMSDTSKRLFLRVQVVCVPSAQSLDSFSGGNECRPWRDGQLKSLYAYSASLPRLVRLDSVQEWPQQLQLKLLSRFQLKRKRHLLHESCGNAKF